MVNSSITYNKKGEAIGFIGPDAIAVYQAAVIATGIGLLQKGIKPARGWSMKLALEKATEFTGIKYKRTESDKAIEHLKIWIETMKSALPIDEE